jgi:hypothetical protein
MSSFTELSRFFTLEPGPYCRIREAVQYARMYIFMSPRWILHLESVLLNVPACRMYINTLDWFSNPRAHFIVCATATPSSVTVTQSHHNAMSSVDIPPGIAATV